jgi:hypothetical protein
MRFRLYVHHHLRLLWHAVSSIDTRSFFLLKSITKNKLILLEKRRIANEMMKDEVEEYVNLTYP